MLTVLKPAQVPMEKIFFVPCGWEKKYPSSLLEKLFAEQKFQVIDDFTEADKTCSEHESFQQLKYQETVSLLYIDAGLPVFNFDFTFTPIIDVVILSQTVNLLGRTFRNTLKIVRQRLVFLSVTSCTTFH